MVQSLSNQRSGFCERFLEAGPDALEHHYGRQVCAELATAVQTLPNQTAEFRKEHCFIERLGAAKTTVVQTQSYQQLNFVKLIRNRRR